LSIKWGYNRFSSESCRSQVLVAHACNPSTQETEIRRIKVRSQQIVHKTLSQKTLHKKKAGEVVQGVGPEFKPQYPPKKSCREGCLK
jgi:hypothetical protein